jgi:diacylglycerol kinase family enzyme
MYFFIVNPAAGNNAFLRFENQFREKASEAKILGELMKTTVQSDARRFAEMAVKRGYTTIIVVGGDETICEVLHGMFGSDVMLGVIPVGKKNYFAKRHGIPLDWKEAVDVICQRSYQEIVLPYIKEYERFFLTSVDIGITEYMKYKEQTLSWLQSRDSMNLSFSQTFEAEITLNKGQSRLQSICSAISINFGGAADNGLPYSSCLYTMKDALQLFVMPAYSKFSIKNEYTSLLCEQISIKTSTPQHIYADGRCIGKTPVSFGVTPFMQKILTQKRHSNIT